MSEYINLGEKIKINLFCGPNVIIKYPQVIELSRKIFLQVYGTHEYNQEVGVISLIY